MSWIGVTAILLGVLFSAYAGNEWMRQLVIERVTPASLELPTAECPEDELAEEGLSGWGTTWWWLVDLPYWGHEDEAFNQLNSELHLWACWGLLVAMAGHIGAALLHAFRNDGIIRRILPW